MLESRKSRRHERHLATNTRIITPRTEGNTLHSTRSRFTLKEARLTALPHYINFINNLNAALCIATASMAASYINYQEWILLQSHKTVNISVNNSLFAGKSFILQLANKLVNISHCLPSFSDWRLLHWHNLREQNKDRGRENIIISYNII